MTAKPEPCGAVSPDGTRCDRPLSHWGTHDGPIVVGASGDLNRWTWAS